MKPLIIGYVAPPSFPYAKAFYENIHRFKTDSPMVLFSDHDWPGLLRLSKSPESVLKHAHWLPEGRKRWAIHNAIFFTALNLAQQKDATHIIYMDGDSRVFGDYWDRKMLEEYEANGSKPLAGSLAFHGPMDFDSKMTELWKEATAINTKDNYPVATYGRSDKVSPLIFINGALGIYSMEFMRELFVDFHSNGYMKRLVQECTAWDYEIGRRMWKKYKHGAIDKIHHMRCIYSGYGDIATTEAERIKMLEDGKVVAVHQVKSSWMPGLNSSDPVHTESKPSLTDIRSREEFGSWLNANGLTGIGVEVGSLSCGYARSILQTWQGDKLFVVDPWEPQPPNIYKEKQDWINFDNCYNDCLEFCNDNPGRVVMIRGLSPAASSQFEDDSLDFVYIDGNHAYEAVMADMEAWCKKVRPGGLLCGHDYWNDVTWPAFGQAKDAVNDWNKGNNWNFHHTPACGSWWMLKPW